MQLTYLGHSCFKLEKDNYTLIIDPYFDGSVPGLINMRETANEVICSHGHKDHSGIEMVDITTKSVSPFSIKVIDTYHDEVCGAKRGNNKIHVIGCGNMKIAHLGDMGCELTDEQRAMLKGVDIMLIPVGGFYTIDAGQAREIVLQCTPKLVIPMHYRSDKYKFGYDVMSTVDDFVKMMSNVKLTDLSQIDTADEFDSQVIVMVPQNISK